MNRLFDYNLVKSFNNDEIYRVPIDTFDDIFAYNLDSGKEFARNAAHIFDSNGNGCVKFKVDNSNALLKERKVEMQPCECNIYDSSYIAIPITSDLLFGLSFVIAGEYLVHEYFVNKLNAGGSANQIVIFRMQDIDVNGNLASSYSKSHIKYIHQVIRQLNVDFTTFPKL